METKSAEFLKIQQAFQTLSYEEIRNQIEALLAGLTKKQLEKIARLSDMTLLPRNTKGEWIAEMIRRVLERKGSWDRCATRFAL
jgi:hypothetical protein